MFAMVWFVEQQFAGIFVSEFEFIVPVDIPVPVLYSDNVS
jgi:hypothetical protein